MICLISSVSEEGNLILRNIKGCRVPSSPILRIIQGRIQDKAVAYAVSGMGKTNAAHAATILIEKFSPEIVILFGIGGTYPSSGLRVGDIAVAEKEIYGDEGVLTKEGFQGTEFIRIPLLKKGRKKYFNEFPLDKRLARRCLSILELDHSPLPLATEAKTGPFVTVSACTGTKKRALELEKKHNAICENMEGAAVAHVCAMYKIPVIEMRGVSNIVEDRDRSKWDLALAAENCQKAVIEVLSSL